MCRLRAVGRAAAAGGMYGQCGSEPRLQGRWAGGLGSADNCTSSAGCQALPPASGCCLDIGRTQAADGMQVLAAR